jgi:hypothetical protein
MSECYLKFIKQTTNYTCINGKKTNPKGLYLCKCGNTVEVFINSVNSGNTKSCGCLKKSGTSWMIHGLCEHPLYGVWKKIKSRCYDKKEKAYRNYGAIGVRVCDEWNNNPKSFIDWALANGWKKGMQIDKDIIPKKIGIPALLYSPDMCSVVTPSENNLSKKTNRIVVFNGKSQTLREWEIELNVKYTTLLGRLNRHNSLDKPKKKNESCISK